MENTRLYIFFGLALLIIIGFYLLVPTPKAPPVVKNIVESVTPSTSGNGQSPATLSGTPAALPAPASRLAAAPQAAKQVTIDTPLVHATVDTLGGRLTSLQLKHYHQ